jgi:autotransporter-associated beta strand protein
MGTSFKRTKHATTKLFSFLALLMMLGVNGVMGQTNYVSWDFSTSITNANYASSQTNQDGARTTALTSTTFGGITLAKANATTANTFHRSTGWTNNTASVTASAESYIQFSITLGGGQTFPNSSFTLNINAGTSSTTSAPNRLQPIYGYGASPTYATIGSAITLSTSQTALSTITVPAPGNTTTTKLTIRLAAFATGASAQSGNLRYQSIALANLNAPITVTPSIAITAGGIGTGSPNNGQTNVVLQRYDMAITSATPNLTGLTVTTAGTYAAADLTNLKVRYSTDATLDGGDATLSTITTSLGAGSQVFPSFVSQSLASGSTYYIFVTADIASGATNGNTINIGTTANGNFTFSSGTISTSSPVAAGGVQTITVAVPDIALTSPAASSANINVGTTNNVVYRFDLAITTATPSLTGVTINTSTGSNISGDLTNLKCWYQTSTTFNAGTATLLSTKTTSLAAGSQVFPTFSSQSLATDSTYYIFITADVPLTATPNNTIIVSAITTADLTFSSGNKTGSANASGTKTIIDCTPADVTSAAASSANLSSVLTWVNPTCYDEILIVAALASNTGTPSGYGSAYTDNLAYGSGTALGNGFVVYKGSTSSQTITGLTNGTQYFYKFFTRRGTTWTSGTEVDATPNISGYYWNGASIAANPAAGGTGTWGTANSWRQPSASGAQATWANDNNAIFAGTAGTVTMDADRTATAYYFNTTGYELINTTTRTLTGSINLANNVGLTLSSNVNTGTPVGGTLNLGSISGTGTANITINSAQGSATNVAQRINLATASSSISVPINIVSAGGSGTGTVAGIVATALGTSLSSAATITNNTAIKTVIGATSGNDITVNGVISGSADLMFAAGASGGAGTITLAAANTYTGATIFNAANSGVIRLGIANALPSSTNVTFGYSSGNGGSLDLNGFNQTLASIINGGFGSSVNKIVNNGSTDATLTINGSTSPTAFVFGIQDGTTNKIALVKAGSGTLILDGSTTTSGNTYTGLTTVSGGTLRLNRSGGNTIPATNNVTVDGGTLQVSTNQTLNNLTLTSGTVIIDAGVTLTINGTITRTSGVIQGTATSNLVITGASGTIAFDQTTPRSTNVLRNLTISGSGTTTLGNALNIIGGSSFGVVTVGTGATLATGGNLTLESTATGTASIGNSAGTISGNVNVERFISQRGRRWRYISAPVSGQTLADWGTKFYITGPGTPGATVASQNSNGYATSRSNLLGFNNAEGTPASVRIYNRTTTGTIENGWANPASNMATTLTPGVGYRAFIRGPITGNYATDTAVIGYFEPGAAPTQSSFTLTQTGGITNGVNAGSVSMPINSTGTDAAGAFNASTDGWNLLGNPYPCAFDWLAFWSANTNRTNIANVIYIFDATANSYKSYNTSSGGSLTSGIIPSGSAFFVQATGTGASLTFTEAFKTSSAPIALHKKGTTSDELQIKYYRDSTESDQYILKMINGATLQKDDYDIIKLKNDNLNLSSYAADSINLTLSSIPVVIEETKISLNVEATQRGTYKFDFNTINDFDNGISVSLLDKFTQKTIDTRKNPIYSFVMDSMPHQWGKDRFVLILNANSTTTSIENENSIINTKMAVYPNPASDVLNISISNANFKNSSISIYNVSGSELLNSTMNGASTQLNIEALSSGVYFVKVKNENGFDRTVKFIK